MEHFSTGIYFPSVITPDTNVRSTSIGTNYQNLKYQFDLYKDIPLQLQNNFNSDNESLLSIASIPYILYQTIKIIEEKAMIMLKLLENYGWHQLNIKVNGE